MLHLDRPSLRVSPCFRVAPIALAAALLAPVGSAQVVFQAGELISNDHIKANSAIGCDVDGDGDRDVVACWVEDNVVSWHENLDGAGGAWATHVISTNIIGSRYAHAADVDGDGDVDVLTASCLDDEAAWYENVNGDGTVWTERSITVLANCAQYVTTEDIDEDGDLDVVVASYLDSKIAWHENVNGDGTAWVEHVLSADRNGGREATTGDVDGDGDPDVLGAWSESAKVAWYDNTAGDGSAWTKNEITTGSSGADSVATADLDGDGDLDALGASFIDGHVRWYENALGDASVWNAHVVDAAATLADSVAAGDLDHDGDLDVFAAIFGDAVIAWYENTAGDASAWTKHVVSDAVPGARRVRLDDVDADGDLDVLGALYESSEVRLYRNVTPGPPALAVAAEAVIASGLDGAASAVAFDPDSDGDLDVAAVAAGAGTVTWHANVAGDATAWTASPVSSGWSNPRALGAADLDDDGDADLLSAAVGSGAVHWHENLAGDGSGWLDRPIDLALVDPYGVHVADVDRDGTLDVLTATDSGAVGWHGNAAGDGSTWSHAAIAGGLGGARGVVSADVDGDGDPDAVTADLGAGAVVWHENVTGDGSVWTTSVVTGAPQGAADVAVADVDGDGDVDVLVVASVADKVYWCENLDGAGGSWSDHMLANGVDQARAVAGVDVDLDGDVDILVASGNDDTVAWYENLGGAGAAWKRHAVTVTADGAADASPADLDGDGFQDVLIAAEFGGRVTWAEARSSLPPATEILPCSGNPDGSLVVLGGAPAVGGTLTLGIDDPLGSTSPGALSVLLISVQPATTTACGIAVPGLGMGPAPGMLQISVASAHVVATLTGPAWSGTGQPAAVGVPIPVSQPLVEKTIYAQGALFDATTFQIGLAQAAKIRIGP